MPADEKKEAARLDARPPLPRNNWDAAQLGIFLAVGAVILLSILPALAVPLGFFLEFILPIPVCLRARSKVILLSLIPNIVINGFFVSVRAPRSPYWAGWRYEWKEALIPLGFGAAASLTVSGLFILWRRKHTERT